MPARHEHDAGQVGAGGAAARTTAVVCAGGRPTRSARSVAKSPSSSACHHASASDPQHLHRHEPVSKQARSGARPLTGPECFSPQPAGAHFAARLAAAHS